ncbi:MAG: hypothetical protein SGJ04_07285 [Bacteroidota bacterium]|nr:hypothetical protein [Bacteroidota bacterium]
MRFTDVREVFDMEKVIKQYILAAVEVEKSGLRSRANREKGTKHSEELQTILDQIPELKSAFAALSLGCQRGYSFYFAVPKQSKKCGTNRKIYRTNPTGEGIDGLW